MTSDLETLAAMLLDEEIREQNAARERQYERAAQHRERAALIERMMGIAKEHGGSGLTNESSSTTITTMNATANDTLARAPRGAKYKAKHPLIERATELGKKMPAVRAELEDHFKRAFPPSTVRTWYLPKKNDESRPVPRDVAEYFARKPWSLPLSVWSRIAD